MIGSLGDLVWVDAIKYFDVLKKGVLILGSIFREGRILFSHAADNLILHISDILLPAVAIHFLASQVYFGNRPRNKNI